MSTRIPLLMLLLVECINASPIQAPFVSSPPLMIAGYYACWTASVFPPESVNFTKLDWVDFAFAIPNENQEIGWEDDNHSQVLHRLVRAAHVQGTKVKLTRHFSKSVSTNSTRHTFASNLVKLYKLYNLDGIDIDWEYPGREGQPGNVYNPRDSFHLLEFLHVLRGLLPSDARISAAVQTVPFVDQNGNSMSDVSEFANVLDWAMVMNYDVWGASSTPGPNAPLSDNCKNSTQPEASAEAAVSSWTTAGFPVNQLVLGLPSYGYLSTSDVSHLRQRRAQTIRLENEEDDRQIQFRELVLQGALERSQSTSTRSPMFVGAGGFERSWDGCSSTPMLRSEMEREVVSYDDPESVGMKTVFARRVGMYGVSLFDLHGDTDEGDLLGTMERASLGMY